MKKLLKKKSLLFLLILIVSLGAFSRFYKLGADSLWIDEIFTATRAKSSLVSLFIKTSEEASFGYAPIDRLFVHFAFYFGKSEFIVRFPSVIFGLLTILLIYKLGMVLFNERVGLIAAFLLSVSTLHIEYSQQARYYVYVVFFSLLSLFFLYKALRENNKKFWLLFIASIFVNVLSHLTTLIFLGIQILFTLFWLMQKKGKEIEKLIKNQIKQKKFKAGLIGGFVFLFIILFYLKSYFSLFQTIKLNCSTPFSTLVNYTLTKLSGGSGLILILYVVFFILGILLAFKRHRQEIGLLIMLFFIPPLTLFFVRPAGYDFHIRYVIFILPIYLLVIALGIDSVANYLGQMIRGRFKKGLLILRQALIYLPILVAFSVGGANSIRNYYERPKEDWRGLGRYLEKNLQFDDIVVTESVYRKMTVEYYYERGRENSLVKTAVEPLAQINKYPFRRYFLQHDYVGSSGLSDLETTPLAETEETKSFPAGTTSMYLFRSRPIWFWQEAEASPFENKGWGVSDYWGKKVMGTDSLTSPSAFISYKIDVPVSGNYNLYANLRWDGARGVLKYKIDSGKWSEGLQPFYGEKGSVAPKWRFKEVKLGSRYLVAGEHQISFLNDKTQDEGDRYQTIDYFYLTLND